MTPEELLKLLDLKGARADHEKEPALDVSAVEEVPKESASPTALEVDEWSLRRGRDLLKESERIQKLALDDFPQRDRNLLLWVF